MDVHGRESAESADAFCTTWWVNAGVYARSTRRYVNTADRITVLLSFLVPLVVGVGLGRWGFGLVAGLIIACLNYLLATIRGSVDRFGN